MAKGSGFPQGGAIDQSGNNSSLFVLSLQRRIVNLAQFYSMRQKRLPLHWLHRKESERLMQKPFLEIFRLTEQGFRFLCGLHHRLPIAQPIPTYRIFLSLSHCDRITGLPQISIILRRFLHSNTPVHLLTADHSVFPKTPFGIFLHQTEQVPPDTENRPDFCFLLQPQRRHFQSCFRCLKFLKLV